MVCSGNALLGAGNGQFTLRERDSFVVPPNVAHCLQISSETTLAVLCLNLAENIEKNITDLMGSLDSDDRHSLDELQELALRLTEQEIHDRPKNTPEPSVQAVAELLQEKPEEVFPLEYLAAVAGYSQWHFLRLFHKETGMTPHAYQLVCRLRLLRSLLRADTAAAEAAVSAGFSDQSHMHKIFKLHHGLTPKQFKQACFKLEP
jgi:AraC-like DNA-binding protein